MFCLLACFFGQIANKKLIECSHSYSQNQLVKIRGIIWTFICYTTDRKIWMYHFEKSAKTFITTFSLFEVDSNGDFTQLDFADGVDKIETSYNHEPEICGNIVQVRLGNRNKIDINLGNVVVLQHGKYECIGNALYYDNNCSINKIK